MENLIVARVIQGLGAGMMIPVSIALISDLFPPEKRGVMIGAFSFVQLVANLLSPILGSVITKQLGWHWIFYITLVLVLIAILLVALDNKKTSPIQRHRCAGRRLTSSAACFSGFSACSLVSFSNSVSKLGQLELTGISLLIGAVTTGLILAWNESRHKDPVIKLAFFQTKVLRQSIFSSLIAGSIMYGLVTLLPLCSVILKQNGFDADESQLLMIFMVGTTLGLIITSRFINKLNAMFPKIIWGLSVHRRRGDVLRHQRQQFCPVQHRYRFAWAESGRNYGNPADQFPERRQQRGSNRLERSRPVGALSWRGGRGDRF